MTPFHPSTTKSAGRALVKGAAALLSALGPSSGASAQCQYSVTSWSGWQCSWEPPNGYTGTGLNDLGAWCGYRHGCYPEDEFNWYPVYCPPGGMPQVLPIPEGASEDGARATAVNNAGIVVGYMYAGSSSQYFHGVIWWPDGTVDVIAPLQGSDISMANDVSNSGVIVGTSGGLPYVLDDGVMTTIPSPGLGGGTARSVSDSGFVIGEFGSASQNTARGFVWHDGAMAVLEPLSGYLATLPRGVNNLGQVVGASSLFVGGSVGYLNAPTIWIDGAPIALPLPAGYGSGGCLGVNDAGVIIGFAQPGGSSQGGVIRVLWVGDEVFTLSSLLIPGSPSVGSLVDLNQAGEILSGGGPKLLTPTSWGSADLNGDCAVNGDDLGVLLASWGVPDFDPRCDFNDDGIVDGDDLGTLLGEWSLPR